MGAGGGAARRAPPQARPAASSRRTRPAPPARAAPQCASRPRPVHTPPPHAQHARQSHAGLTERCRPPAPARSCCSATSPGFSARAAAAGPPAGPARRQQQRARRAAAGARRRQPPRRRSSARAPTAPPAPRCSRYALAPPRRSAEGPGLGCRPLRRPPLPPRRTPRLALNCRPKLPRDAANSSQWQQMAFQAPVLFSGRK